VFGSLNDELGGFTPPARLIHLLADRSAGNDVMHVRRMLQRAAPTTAARPCPCRTPKKPQFRERTDFCINDDVLSYR
jgi:hypothetical protein